MDKARFLKQLDFIYEIDKVKSIIRKTKLFDNSRFENDAEHSWTICVMAYLLKEYANFEVDIQKVILMLLIHDVVEIDAGDVYLYAPHRDSVHQKEEEAARRIFGILDNEQGALLVDLWREFEQRKTNEAKFAAVFDRIEPVLQNYRTEGFAWKTHNIRKHQVIEKNKHIAEGSREIWEFVCALLDECVAKGYLAE